MSNKDFDKKIEQMNLRIAEILCSIGVSMITAVITVLLYIRFSVSGEVCTFIPPLQI